MKLIKTKLIMSYKISNNYKKKYLLGEYIDLSGNDYQKLKYGWMRKIKKELNLSNDEFRIYKIEDEYYKPESYLTLLK